MSNIANQVVAVVATLLGFVTHDLLSERDAPAAVVANATFSAAVDPVVTRSVELQGIAVEDWLTLSPRAERKPLTAPSARMSRGTAAARPDPRNGESEFADVRINDARAIAPGQAVHAAYLR